MSARADRGLLSGQYPKCFPPAGGCHRKQPLKFGIAADLIQRGVVDACGNPISPARIRAALDDYKRGSKYCWSVARGGYRIDLDGQPCGFVDRGHQQAAHARIVRMGWQNHDGQEGIAA